MSAKFVAAELRAISRTGPCLFVVRTLRIATGRRAVSRARRRGFFVLVAYPVATDSARVELVVEIAVYIAVNLDVSINIGIPLYLRLSISTAEADAGAPKKHHHQSP